MSLEAIRGNSPLSFKRPGRRHMVYFLTFQNLALLCLQSPKRAVHSNSQLDRPWGGPRGQRTAITKELWEMCGLVTATSQFRDLGQVHYPLPLGFLIYKMRDWNYIEDLDCVPRRPLRGRYRELSDRESWKVFPLLQREHLIFICFFNLRFEDSVVVLKRSLKTLG